MRCLPAKRNELERRSCASEKTADGDGEKWQTNDLRERRKMLRQPNDSASRLLFQAKDAERARRWLQQINPHQEGLRMRFKESASISLSRVINSLRNWVARASLFSIAPRQRNGDRSRFWWFALFEWKGLSPTCASENKATVWSQFDGHLNGVRVHVFATQICVNLWKESFSFFLLWIDTEDWINTEKVEWGRYTGALIYMFDGYIFSVYDPNVRPAARCLVSARKIPSLLYSLDLRQTKQSRRFCRCRSTQDIVNHFAENVLVQLPCLIISI